MNKQDKCLVSVVMGSDSDLGVMEESVKSRF
jgi:phosphoribosylcarboxyaminoimidazole (NCAIR) mutase